MHRIIGGVFGLDLSEDIKSSSPEFLSGEVMLMVNARSAIYQIISHGNFKKIWLPSYLCEVICRAADNVNTGFYPVDCRLQLSDTGWLETVDNNHAVLVIDYFGIPMREGILKKLKQTGACLIRDASQALLNANSESISDFVVYSPRKFLGVPDGGILSARSKDHLSKVNLLQSPDTWWLSSLDTITRRNMFDISGGDNTWFSMFQKNDTNAPIGSYAMSELTLRLLRSNFDYDEISRKRRENYHFLAEHLGDLALFPELTDNTVPIGFPVLLDNRDDVRNGLFENGIYPPVHWQIEGIVPDSFIDSHQVSKRIMTLVCDQRYDLDDMARIVRLIKKYF